MQERQTAGVTAVEHALTEQLTAIKQAAQQGLINSAQALVLWKRARRDRESGNKQAILSNSVCTAERVETHDFEVSNSAALHYSPKSITRLQSQCTLLLQSLAPFSIILCFMKLLQGLECLLMFPP